MPKKRRPIPSGTAETQLPRRARLASPAATFPGASASVLSTQPQPRPLHPLSSVPAASSLRFTPITSSAKWPPVWARPLCPRSPTSVRCRLRRASKGQATAPSYKASVSMADGPRSAFFDRGRSVSRVGQAPAPSCWSCRTIYLLSVQGALDPMKDDSWQSLRGGRKSSCAG